MKGKNKLNVYFLKKTTLFELQGLCDTSRHTDRLMLKIKTPANI